MSLIPFPPRDWVEGAKVLPQQGEVNNGQVPGQVQTALPGRGVDNEPGSRAKYVVTPRLVAIALVPCMFHAACDKTPISRIPVSSPTPVTVGDGPPMIRSLEVIGPQVVALNEVAQFRLMAHSSDGSSRDVTSEAHWQPEDSRVLSVSTPGAVAGIDPGETRLSATFAGSRGLKDVMVLPAGTYRLLGHVAEADIPSGPIAGALVEVTTGIGAGLIAHSDSLGTYRLYGVAGQIGLRVTKNGYQSTTRMTSISDHRAAHLIELPLVVPRANVAGRYTLTISAAQECGIGLGEGHVTEEARVRSYDAVVRQDGPRLEVTASGATIRESAFSGRVEPGGVLFDLSWYNAHDAEESAIYDRLSASRVLNIGGSVTATGPANRLSGALDGNFRVFEATSVGMSTIASCSSASHQFVLSR